MTPTASQQKAEAERIATEAAEKSEVALPPAANVVEALTRVMRELPAIGRDSQASQQQGGYAYRGIEQITRHTQGLFAKHGVVFVPHVRAYEVRDLVVNGKPWTDVYELVEYTVYGPGGAGDSITVGPILAIGRDNSDKGANKCLTQAYKYALLQALCISDAKDDGDGATHEAESRPTRHAEPPAHVPGAQRLCAVCGGSLEGAKVERHSDGWAHKGDCPTDPNAPGPGQLEIEGGEVEG